MTNEEERIVNKLLNNEYEHIMVDSISEHRAASANEQHCDATFYIKNQDVKDWCEFSDMEGKSFTEILVELLDLISGMYKEEFLKNDIVKDSEDEK